MEQMARRMAMVCALLFDTVRYMTTPQNCDALLSLLLSAPPGPLPRPLRYPRPLSQIRPLSHIHPLPDQLHNLQAWQISCAAARSKPPVTRERASARHERRPGRRLGSRTRMSPLPWRRSNPRRWLAHRCLRSGVRLAMLLNPLVVPLYYLSKVYRLLCLDAPAAVLSLQ